MSQTILTERLLLRRWRDEDRLPFSKINTDPRVMEFMPACLSREESDALIARIEDHFDANGFGPFAIELLESNSLVGFVGRFIPSFDAHFMPAVEIGWRLAADQWGRGLACEGARAVLRQSFETLGFDDVVSFTVPANLRSRRVMEKIGMTHDPADDFDHPKLPEGHPLRHHVLYRLSSPR